MKHSTRTALDTLTALAIRQTCRTARLQRRMEMLESALGALSETSPLSLCVEIGSEFRPVPAEPLRVNVGAEERTPQAGPAKAAGPCGSVSIPSRTLAYPDRLIERTRNILNYYTPETRKADLRLSTLADWITLFDTKETP